LVMKTQHVRCFSATCDELSFNYVAQGAAIKRIEPVFGGYLFVRS
jgi:hypothetical protein